MIEQWLLELQSQKKVLAIGRTSQHGGMQKGDGARQLGFVDQSDRNFQRDLRCRGRDNGG